jgi:hypothetical protein
MKKNMERNMYITKHDQPKLWWQQLWPWLLMCGPAVAIFACAITIWLAVNQYPDKPLLEGVVRQGLKVEQVKK